MNAYRTPSYPTKEPVPPLPALPFTRRFPGVYKAGKAILTTLLGAAIISAVIALVSLLIVEFGRLVQWLGLFTTELPAGAALLAITVVVMVGCLVGGVIYGAFCLGSAVLKG